MKSKHEILADLLSDDSFVRWIKGEASPNEQYRWNSWVKENDERRAVVRQAQRMYNIPFSRVEEDDTKAQLHRLQQEIDKREHIRWPRGIRPVRKSRWTVYAAVAGVVLLVAVMLTFYQQQSVPDFSHENFVRLQTQFGQKDSVRLGDGSMVILNANSSLRYNPGALASSNMHFRLEGEAYFDIIHNPERKLVVHTDDGQVEDIGTKFNVNTRGRGTSVALVEGRVKVIQNNSTGATPESYEASPGEFIQFTDSGQSIAVSRSNLDVHVSWIQDKLVLDDTPFREIVSKLEQTYGVDIVVSDEDLMNRKVSGSIRSPSLDIVLEGLAKTMRLNVERKGEKILISSIDQR